MALQSEFHPDLSKIEPIVWKSLTKSQLIMIVQIIPAVVVIGVELVFIHGFMFYIIALLTSMLFVVPAFLKGTGRLEAAKANWFFNMKIQERYYSSGQIRKYTADEFIQKKEVKETDSFTN